MRQTDTMEQKDEARYIEHILNGETHLFSTFVENYSHSLFALIVQIVGSPEDAEELVQDTFMKAFKSLGSYKGECRLLTWLYRIAYNVAISATRKSKQTVLFIEENTINNVPDEAADSIMEKIDSEERVERLIAAIDCLTPNEKALITLFYMEERSIEEVSQIMKLTVVNIKVRLYRTRKKLYLIMTENNEEIVSKQE